MVWLSLPFLACSSALAARHWLSGAKAPGRLELGLLPFDADLVQQLAGCGPTALGVWRVERLYQPGLRA